MNVKERMLSLRLLKKKECYSEFFDEIGLSADMKVTKSKVKEMEEKTWKDQYYPK